MAGSRALLLAVIACAALRPVTGVDRHKFRTCEQGSFCRRYKKWLQRPGSEEALWSVLPATKEVGTDGTISYLVQHRQEAAPHLRLRLNFYVSGIVRFRVGEVEPLHPRHEIPAGDAVTSPEPPAAQVQAEDGGQATTFRFDASSGAKVAARLLHEPVGLEVSVDGVVVQRLNGRNHFNFERYREPQRLRPPDANAGDASVVLDAAATPHNQNEEGLWEENFGGHEDKKPRGPASFGMDMAFIGEIPSLFGLPEHASKANLPKYEEPYRFFNLDVFEYEIDNPMALYGAIPLLWAVRAGDKPGASAFLWINPSETFVKLEETAETPGEQRTWWVSESGVLDACVLAGPTPALVSAQYHALTGHAPLAPLWALGKHQCRWNYMSEKDTLAVDAAYDKYDIPYDTIWLDIEHTDGKAYFTWNDAQFPDPKKMIDTISAKRRKFVNVVDPHMKKDEKFQIYKDIKELGYFIKKVNWVMKDDPNDTKPADWVEVEEIDDPEAKQPDIWNAEEDGEWKPMKIKNPAYNGAWKARQITDPDSGKSDFEGWCWPGTSLYPDFTDPRMREYWGSQFALDKYKGTNADTYIWNDMNEPSVFNAPEVTMPRDAIHPNGNVEHRDVHNMYGYYVHRATFEGLQKRSPNDRPFVLTRSFFIGSHKYATIWTGDNYAKWEHLQASIAMIGALALGGQSLVGADVGGFFKHPTEEMAVRWYQLGVIAYPFLRNHAHLETPRREPYTFDESAMFRIKTSLQLRYRMLPYWYTLFQEYHALGRPVVRPLFWDFVGDAVTHADENAVENQLMLGDAVLVRGVTQALADLTDSSVKVYLPSGAGWYDMVTGVYHKSGFHDVKVTLDEIPTYVRAGAILPLKLRARRSSACMAMDPLTLDVYLDPERQEASGHLYIDDYRTKNYEDGRSFLDMQLSFAGGELKAASRSGALPEGEVAAEVERVEVIGLKAAPKAAVLVAGGATIDLPAPASRELGDGLYAAVLKVVPFLNLRSEWSIRVS